VTATVGGLLCQAGQRLRAAAIGSPRLEARLLLAHALGCRTDDLLRDPHAAVSPEPAARFAALLGGRLEHTPIAYLTGEREFWSLPFLVSPATLIPRPDSETLVEAALAAFPERGVVRRVLDLGTGTGCLLLAALTEFPDAFGVGMDRIPEAAALAARNAGRLGLSHRAAFVAADWAAPLAGRFDLILCNPPYIPTVEIAGLMPDVADHEPVSALDGGADGLAAYRVVLGMLPRVLAPGGQAVLELGAGQCEAVTALAFALGLVVAARHADIGGVARALTVGSLG